MRNLPRAVVPALTLSVLMTGCVQSGNTEAENSEDTRIYSISPNARWELGTISVEEDTPGLQRDGFILDDLTCKKESPSESFEADRQSLEDENAGRYQQVVFGLGTIVCGTIGRELETEAADYDAELLGFDLGRLSLELSPVATDANAYTVLLDAGTESVQVSNPQLGK